MGESEHVVCEPAVAVAVRRSRMPAVDRPPPPAAAQRAQTTWIIPDFNSLDLTFSAGLTSIDTFCVRV